MFAVHYVLIQRERTRLRRWAYKNGYELLYADVQLFGGPFGWLPKRNQFVFAIAVRAPGGERRTGYARCSKRITVKWDPEP